MENEEKKKEGLSTTKIIFFISLAIFFDFFQFLLSFLWLGWLVGIFAGLTFWFIFSINGIKIGFSNPKRALGIMLTAIVEMVPIPFLASLPGWTIYVSVLCLKNKAKDVPILNNKKLKRVASIIESVAKSGAISKSQASPTSSNGNVLDLRKKKEDSGENNEGADLAT